MADMTVGRVIPAVNSGNYPLIENVLDKQKIVRCKDCGKRFSSECPLVRADPYETLDSDDDWFCADGMRKDRDPNG